MRIMKGYQLVFEHEILGTKYSCFLMLRQGYYFLEFMLSNNFTKSKTTIKLADFFLRGGEEEGREIVNTFEDDINNFYSFLLGEIIPRTNLEKPG